MATEHTEFVAAARALDEAFARHANACQTDRLVAAYYADDAQVLPPNAPLVQGRGQIREFFRELIEAGADDVTRETSQLHVDGDLGYGVGTSTLAMRQPGREPHRATGKHLLVYRRQPDGAWRIAVDMFSSDLPAR